MIVIVKEFSNGFNECVTIKSDSEKLLLEKSTGVLYDGECDIIKDKLSDFEEAEPVIEEEEKEE